MTIRVNDIRAFGRKVLVGTHVIDSLHSYFMDHSSFVKRNEEETDPMANKGEYLPPGDVSTFMYAPQYSR